jgi:hypothetical protein
MVFSVILSEKLSSQGKEARVNAQEILAKLDETLNFGDGLTKGNLTLIQRSGNTNSWVVNLFRSRSNLLYLFDKKGRGLENKLLSLDEGDRIFVFNTISSKLFRKAEDEKYENFMNSGFGFVEFSGYLYQANYDPIMNGDIKIKGETFIRVSLKPIITYSYKKLVLLMNKEKMEPVRIDFHDKEGVLYKTLNIKYGNVKFKSGDGSQSNKRMVSRLEMLTLNTGNIGVWEIQEVDQTVKTDSSLFDVENIGR